ESCYIANRSSTNRALHLGQSACATGTRQGPPSPAQRPGSRGRLQERSEVGPGVRGLACHFAKEQSMQTTARARKRTCRTLKLLGNNRLVIERTANADRLTIRGAAGQVCLSVHVTADGP